MFDLKMFRVANKLTQVQIAEYFGVTQAYISQIERGILELPIEYISKIKADGKYKMPYSEQQDDINKVNLSEPDVNYSPLEILIKAVDRLVVSEKNNSENIAIMNANMKELIAQGRQQTDNITKLVDLLCQSGISFSNNKTEYHKEAMDSNVKGSVELTRKKVIDSTDI